MIINKILESKTTTIILSVILGLMIAFFLTGALLSLFETDYISTYDDFSFEYTLKDKNFSKVSEYKLLNDFHKVEATTLSMKEYYIIAEYYNAAINYKLAIARNENTEIYKDIMNEKASQIVMYEYYIEDINEILKLN